MDGLETIKAFAETNRQARFYPATEWAVRGLHRNRRAFGLTAAFTTVGSRVLIDRAKFYELLAKRGNARNCAA